MALAAPNPLLLSLIARRLVKNGATGNISIIVIIIAMSNNNLLQYKIIGELLQREIILLIALEIIKVVYVRVGLVIVDLSISIFSIILIVCVLHRFISAILWKNKINSCPVCKGIVLWALHLAKKRTIKLNLFKNLESDCFRDSSAWFYADLLVIGSNSVFLLSDWLPLPIQDIHLSS